MKNETMSDIETLSTERNAAILAIGAIRFDPSQLSEIEELADNAFLVAVEPIGQDSLWGRHIDPSTVVWWQNQSEDARWFTRDDVKRLTLVQALQAYHAWLMTAPVMWARGPQFDLEVLRNAFRRVGMQESWGYNAGRDVRTLMDVVPPSIFEFPEPAGFIKHHPVHDCVKQAWQVQRIVHWINR